MNLKPSTYRDRGNSRDPCSQLSRSVAIIVPQHTTEPLTAFDVANNLAHFVSRFDNLIVEPLVVSFAMIEPHNTTPISRRFVKSLTRGIPGTASRLS